MGSAARAANISLDTMLGSMTSFVSAQTKGGALPTRAAQAYMSQLAATGVNPEATRQMDKNSVAMASYSRMGIRPWEIASASGEQKAMAQYQTLSTLYNTYGGRGASMSSAKGQEVLQRIVNFNPDLGLSVPAIQALLNPKGGVGGMSARARASSINSQYGMGAMDESGNLLPGRTSYENMSKEQFNNVLNNIMSTANLTAAQQKELRENLDGDKSKYADKIEAALGAAANRRDISDAVSAPLGNANLSDLAKKAADAMSAMANQLGQNPATAP